MLSVLIKYGTAFLIFLRLCCSGRQPAITFPRRPDNRHALIHGTLDTSMRLGQVNYGRAMSSSSYSVVNRKLKLTHIDEKGRASMVDVSHKPSTERTAVARGRILVPKIAHDLVTEPKQSTIPRVEGAVGTLNALERKKEKARAKGDVLTVAQLSGIMAAKRTADLIPLCHPILLSQIDVRLAVQSTQDTSDDQVEANDCDTRYSVLCEATVTCEGRTGVEMEALTAVSVSLLTIWDMLKAVAGESMLITDIFVSSKTGGKSGDFKREEGH